MRIFKNEIHKLWHNRAFVLTLIIALAISIYTAYTANPDIYLSDSEYKAYYNDVSDMSATEAYDYVQTTVDTLNQSEKGIYSENVWQDIIFLRGEVTKIESIMGYADYLQSIDDTAQKMTSVSIFADENSFSYRNIVRTPPAYEAVKSVTPVYSQSEGVRLAANNPLGDILALFVLVSAVTALYYKDRESGLVALIKPLKYGRARLALIKFSVMACVAVGTFALIYFGNLTVGAFRYGLGDLSRPIQSVEGYLSCNYPISVAQMLVYTFILKAIGLILCGLIASCLMTKLSNSVAYLTLIGIAGIELVLYLTIPETSIFSPLKQINIVAFTQTQRLFVTYQNINFFSFPINLFVTTVICILLGILLAALLLCRLYSKISISEVKRNSRLVIKHKTPTSLFGYTAYKQFIMHKGLLIILAVLALQVYSSYNYTRYYDRDDSYYQSYCLQLCEMSDGEADAFIKSEADRFEAIKQSGAYNAYEELYPERGFIMAKEQYELTRSLGGHAEDCYYQTGYRHIFGLKGLTKDYTLGLIAITALCLCLSPVVAYDNRCRIGYILFTTHHGKKTYNCHNRLMALLIAVTVSMSTYIPYLVQMLITYGSKGLTDSVRYISELQALPNISVLGYIILLTLYRTAILILFSQLLLWISSKCQSQTTAMIITLSLFALPIVIYLAGGTVMEWLSLPVSGNREVGWVCGILYNH